MDRETRNAEIVRRAKAGESERSIARALGTSRSTVWSVKQATKRAASAAAEDGAST